MPFVDRSALTLAVCLAALAGYVDALGFLQLGGYFVSFMSGNSTQAGVDVTKKGPLLPLLLIAGFVAGVAAGSVAGHFSGTRRRTVLLGIVTVLLLGAAACHAAALDRAAITAMVLAMGAENTVFGESAGIHVGLTYITGSLVRIGESVGAALYGRHTPWLPYFLLWAGLISGAIAGGASFHRWGLAGLWIAGAAAGVLTAATLTSFARPSE
jgi:uncharacterized membrane protein YoaK (UPF0700 family)